ncbi:MAG: sugar transferase [Alphaproteobacteria bacterium]|nr:sugar transferase [Alphaproteobacteria bacterium]
MKNGTGVEAGRIAPARSGVLTDVSPYRVQASRVKRVMDVLIASIAAIFLLPLMACIAILVRLTSPGPALFAQRRCGLNGRVFECYKFRTMRVDAAERLERLLATDPNAAMEWARYQKLRNDPRVTPLGRFLRKTSLDELPQLVNILRNEMSVIGPRPITSDEIFRYGPDFHYYTAVRPGVLGLWQVNGRNRLTYDQRVAMDVRYVREWSIWLDITIFAKAAPVVLFGAGAY